MNLIGCRSRPLYKVRARQNFSGLSGLNLRWAPKNFRPSGSSGSSGSLGLSPRSAKFFPIICHFRHILAFYSPTGAIVDVRITRLICPLYKLNAGVVFPDFHPLAQCLHVSRAVNWRRESLNIVSVNRRRNHVPWTTCDVLTFTTKQRVFPGQLIK